MMRRFCCVLAVLMVAHSAPALAAGASACTPKLLAEAEMAVADDGNLLVPVSIGGKPAFMVLHTSLMVTMLEARAVERLGLPTGVVHSNYAAETGGKAISRTAAIPSLSLGAFTYRPLLVAIVPGSEDNPLVEHDGIPIAGYLGMDVLPRTDFELHLAARKLRLFSALHCRRMGAYWSGEYAETTVRKSEVRALYVVMTLDQRPIETSLSTYTAETRLDVGVAARFFGFDAAAAAIPASRAMRKLPLGIEKLAIGPVPVQLKDPLDCTATQRPASGTRAIGFEREGSRCLGIFPLTVGRSTLQALRVYFAREEMKMYFTLADGSLGAP